MKTPTLGLTVLYAALAHEPAQSFVAAASEPPGDAVIAPTPYPAGFRAATVIGFADDPDSGRVALLVYKQPGDPFRGDADAIVQRIGDVPYSPDGLPGTWLLPEEVNLA